MIESSKLYCENNLVTMSRMADNSIDSIVTDPPYGLKFMGKKWDYNVPDVATWAECLRVLKPGGFLLSFAGTRTQHRMAVNIEDAGFEIRDMIFWCYGSGFPKSLNVGKAVDKLQGNEREVVGKESIGTYKSMSKIRVEQGYRKNLTKCSNKIDVTKGTSPYEGWGTALKPALEPITVARKPFKGTVAENVLKWGTGGINIDRCRIEKKDGDRTEYGVDGIVRKNNNNVYGKQSGKIKFDGTQGRFPSNLILNEEAARILDEQSGIGESNKSKSDYKGIQGTQNIFKGSYGKNTSQLYSDSGGASRFFYIPKASKAERNEGLYDTEAVRHSDRNKKDGVGGDNPRNRTNTKKKNFHPTVKPVKLMRYLVRLVTPVGGTVYDPYMGSGTTGRASELEGFGFIGSEDDTESFEIAEIRIEESKYRLF